MVSYNIHNLIIVKVDEGVSESIKFNIDFQIGYFVTERHCNTKYVINVLPFGKYENNEERAFSQFHSAKGIWGNCYYDLNSKLCVVKTNTGFKIYADAPNFLINIFVQILLLMEGYTCIHAAAVSDKSGNVTLLPGPGGVGKTAILGDAVKKHQAQIFGDDIVCIGSRRSILSFPRSFVLKEYHETVYPEVFKKITQDKSNYIKSIKLFLKNAVRIIILNLPLIDLAKRVMRGSSIYNKTTSKLKTPQPLPYVAAVSVEEIFGTGVVQDKGLVKKIVFLERYAGDGFVAIRIDKNDLANRLFAIINHEWVDYMRQIFAMSALGLLDLYYYFSETYRIIVEFLSEIDECQIMKIPEGATPKNLSEAFESFCVGNH